MKQLFLKHYTEAHRAYHNLGHIEHLLKLWKAWPPGWEDSQSVALAIWFHDLIYEPKRRDNEARSAGYAKKYLTDWGLEKARIQKIEAMIIATAGHKADGLDQDGCSFLDLDLSILGGEADVYDAYVKAIRQEYRSFPNIVYRPGRRKILRNFLNRERLYFSETAFHLWEHQARENIKRELTK